MWRVCQAWGDLRIITFDGRHLEVPGACTYILTQPCQRQTPWLPSFKVWAETEATGLPGASRVSAVRVRVHGHWVTLLPRDRARVSSWMCLALGQVLAGCNSFQMCPLLGWFPAGCNGPWVHPALEWVPAGFNRSQMHPPLEWVLAGYNSSWMHPLLGWVLAVGWVPFVCNRSWMHPALGWVPTGCNGPWMHPALGRNPLWHGRWTGVACRCPGC